MNAITDTRENRPEAAAVTAAGTASANSADSALRRQGERAEPALLPPVDVIEDTTGITLYADMPGVPREKLHLGVEGDQLTIEGEFGLEVPPDVQASHAELSRSRYRRTFTLSKELDAEQVSAELAQGVLRVRIPKAAHAQPRKIDVQVR